MQDCINPLYELKALEQKTRLVKAKRSIARNSIETSSNIPRILLITVLLVVGYGITTYLIH